VTWLVHELTSPWIDLTASWFVGEFSGYPEKQGRIWQCALWRMKRKCHVHVNFTLIQLNFGLKQLPYWHSFNLKFTCQGRHYLFVHFRGITCTFVVLIVSPPKSPMFVLGVETQTTEVSQQKFVQKHSHQHTFSWFQSVLGKSGHAELNWVTVQISSATPQLLLIQ